MPRTNEKIAIIGISLLGGVAILSGHADGAIVGFLNSPAGDTRSDTLPQEGFGFYGTALGVAPVNELGYWVSPADSNNTGVTAVDHTIALYHYNGTGYTDVAQVVLPAGSTPDASGYAWVTIPTYVLTDTSQGADYYIVTASCGTDLWTNGGLTVNDPTVGSLTGKGWFSELAPFPGVGGTISSGTTPGTNILNYSNSTYGGPNIGFSAAVPEPTGLISLVFGGLPVLARRRRVS